MVRKLTRSYVTSQKDTKVQQFKSLDKRSTSDQSVFWTLGTQSWKIPQTLLWGNRVSIFVFPFMFINMRCSFLWALFLHSLIFFVLTADDSTAIYWPINSLYYYNPKMEHLSLCPFYISPLIALRSFNIASCWKTV